MTKNKILLFIVEGPSDEHSLAPALEKIINHTARFKVMRSDITCDYASTVNNIEKRIKEQGVKKFLKENSQFTERDICGVVHIVDLDGVFAPDTLAPLITSDMDVYKRLETEIFGDENNE